MDPQAQSSAVGPGRAQGRFGAAYRVLEEAIAARAFPGCAFGVVAGGEVALKDALGRFTYEQESPAVTAETVFDVASLTKVVATTAAAMLLVQRGRLTLTRRWASCCRDLLWAVHRGSGARCDAAALAGAQLGLAGVRGVFPHRGLAGVAVSSLPGAAAGGGAGNAGRVLRPRIHAARQGAGGSNGRGPGSVDQARGFPAAGDECHGILPCAGTAGLNSAHRRGHMVPSSRDSGRGAGRERVGARGCGRTRRALLRCCGSFAFCFSDHQRRSGRRSGRKADSVRAGRAETIYPAARACRAARGRSDGIRLRRIRRRAGIFQAIPSGTSATAVARCGSTWKRLWPLFCSPIEPGPIERVS